MLSLLRPQELCLLLNFTCNPRQWEFIIHDGTWTLASFWIDQQKLHYEGQVGSTYERSEIQISSPGTYPVMIRWNRGEKVVCFADRSEWRIEWNGWIDGSLHLVPYMPLYHSFFAYQVPSYSTMLDWHLNPTLVGSLKRWWNSFWP